MYIRFAVHKKDDDSGRRQGLFQAMSDLEHAGELLEHEQAQYDETSEWFRHNLKKPRSFTRSSKPHAKNVALSWFKDLATEHISKMYELVHILQAHGVDGDGRRLVAGEALDTTTQSLNLANDGVGYAMDENNAPLVTPEMQAKVDEAAAKIKSGEIVVHDYMSDDTCPAAKF